MFDFGLLLPPYTLKMALATITFLLLVGTIMVNSAGTLTRGDRKGLETKCATDGVPIVLPTTQIKQGTRLGTRYLYLHIDNDPGWINPTIVYTRLGVTFLPSTNVSALAVSEKMSFYGQDMQCQGAYLQAYYTIDGREVGLSFWNQDPPMPDVYYDIYAAGDFEFLYNCNRPNLQTSMCSEPWFYVLTHSQPDKLSSADKQKIKTTVDQFFNPHCLKFSDFKEFVWKKNLDKCDPQEPPAFTFLIQGIKQSLAHQDGQNNVKI